MYHIKRPSGNISFDLVKNENSVTIIRYSFGKIDKFDSMHDYNLLSTGMSEWCKGALIQDAFTFMSPADREFLMTGSALVAYFNDDELHNDFDDEV